MKEYTRKCWECGGKGYIVCKKPFQAEIVILDCDHCNGTGQEILEIIDKRVKSKTKEVDIASSVWI